MRQDMHGSGNGMGKLVTDVTDGAAVFRNPSRTVRAVREKVSDFICHLSHPSRQRLVCQPIN